MITLEGLTKRFGDKLAVDDLSLQVRPGAVTGFLGPNGAGKSTTMRMILGLDNPTAGRALVDGVHYADLDQPLRRVGALLDPRTGHPGQTARGHLVGLARSHGIGRARVAEVLDAVGLSSVATKRIGSFSLGMGQRLGIASALLGDPDVLMFDEPVNGLDPDGVLWIRRLMRTLADQGRTVFVSSHLMSEMQQTADHLVVIGRGRLIADAPMDDLISGSAQNSVRVRSPQAERLREELEEHDLTVLLAGPEELRVTGEQVGRIGALAFAARVQIDELTFQRASLEQAYVELTESSVEYEGGGVDLPVGATTEKASA
ncbi:MAG: ATP-binding cassette domain-containing protein [Propionibacteriaceae bacterium]